jgi:hypothetical protein
VVGDSADSNRAKKTTWSQIKTVLASTFGTIASPTFTGTVTTPAIVVSSETASTIASFDASKNIKSLAVATYPTLTELSYVKGVTSALQTQINTKAPSTAPTFATSITGSYLTPSEILITDGSKNIVSAAVATYPSLTELTYLKGVTSAIQTQLNNAVPSYASGTTTKDAADASATQNIAHGLGVIPKYVRIRAMSSDANAFHVCEAQTVYNGTTQSSISRKGNNADSLLVTTFDLSDVASPQNDYSRGVVTFDATNIIITWTKNNSAAGAFTLLWEAQI